MIIAVDFDGTLVCQAPHGFYCKKDIGSEAVLKELIEKGHKIILWTCRNNSKKNPYNYLFDPSARLQRFSAESQKGSICS